MTVSPLVTTTELDAFQAGDAQAAIDGATSAVRTFCGWHVAPSVTETIKTTGKGRCELLLPTLNVTAVTAVRVDGVVLADTDYNLTRSGILTRTGGGWFAVGAAVEVDVTHGYDPVPEDLSEVVMALATRRQANPRGDVQQVQKGPFGESYAGSVDGFTALELRALYAYKVRR